MPKRRSLSRRESAQINPLALVAQGQKNGAEEIPAEAISVQVVDLMRIQYKTRFEDLFSACRCRASGQQVGEKARWGENSNGCRARPETLPENLLPDSTMKRPEPSSLWR